MAPDSVDSEVSRPRVRLAHPDDADWIVDANARLAAETEGRELDRERLRAGVAAVLGDATRGVYWVAELEGRLAGGLLVTREWSDWRSGWFWWIQSVYVHAEARGKGVFRALYDTLLDEAGQRADVCGLRLYVEDENGPAQSTYEAVGMTRTSYQLFETDFVLQSLERVPED